MLDPNLDTIYSANKVSKQQSPQPAPPPQEEEDLLEQVVDLKTPPARIESSQLTSRDIILHPISNIITHFTLSVKTSNSKAPYILISQIPPSQSCIMHVHNPPSKPHLED